MTSSLSPLALTNPSAVGRDPNFAAAAGAAAARRGLAVGRGPAAAAAAAGHAPRAARAALQRGGHAAARAPPPPAKLTFAELDPALTGTAVQLAVAPANVAWPAPYALGPPFELDSVFASADDMPEPPPSSPAV